MIPTHLSPPLLRWFPAIQYDSLEVEDQTKEVLTAMLDVWSGRMCTVVYFSIKVLTCYFLRSFMVLWAVAFIILLLNQFTHCFKERAIFSRSVLGYWYYYYYIMRTYNYYNITFLLRTVSSTTKLPLFDIWKILLLP